MAKVTPSGGTYYEAYIHTYIAYAWLYQVAHLSGSLCFWLWSYWFSFIFWLISIRALAMALLVSMLFSLNISAYLMSFSSLLTFLHSWMMCSWVSSASQQYLHLRVSWPFLWFILTVIMLVLALSIAWLCFLVSLSMYSGLRSLGLAFCFLQWLIFVFSAASFPISFSHSSWALCFRIFLSVYFFSFRCHFRMWYFFIISIVFYPCAVFSSVISY